MTRVLRCPHCKSAHLPAGAGTPVLAAAVLALRPTTPTVCRLCANVSILDAVEGLRVPTVAEAKMIEEDMPHIRARQRTILERIQLELTARVRRHDH